MSNLRFIQDTYAAFASGDVATVLGAFDAAIEWREAENNPYQPTGDAWNGPDAVLESLFLKLADEWDGFEVHPGRYHDSGDTIIMEGRYSGTFKATGKTLDAQMCHIWTIRDGKIVSFQQYVDTAQLRTVMGT